MRFCMMKVSFLAKEVVSVFSEKNNAIRLAFFPTNCSTSYGRSSGLDVIQSVLGRARVMDFGYFIS